MATKLKKPVTRELRVTTDRAGRSLIATLNPDETIEFRPKGKKTRYEIPLGFVYLKAMEYYLNKKYKEDMKKYELDKKLGVRRRKKPSKPIRFTSF